MLMNGMQYYTLRNSLSASSLTSFVTSRVQRDDARRTDMFSPRELIQAARDGQIDQVHEQIHFIGRDKKKLNVKDVEQTTALHYAVRYGHSKIVKLLILNGADVNIVGENGVTPLHYAARYASKFEQDDCVSHGEPSSSDLKTDRSNTGKKWVGNWSKASKAMKRKISLPNIVSALMRKSKQAHDDGGQTSEMGSSIRGNEGACATSPTPSSPIESGDGINMEGRVQERKDFFKRSMSEPAVSQAMNADERKQERAHSPANKSVESRCCDSLVEEVEEDAIEMKMDRPLTLKQVVRKWKERTLGENGGYKYHYDEKSSVPNSKQNVIISTDPKEYKETDIHNIDALILPVLRKETVSDGVVVEACKKRRRSTIVGRPCCNMMLDDDLLGMQNQVLQRDKHRESIASTQTATTTASGELFHVLSETMNKSSFMGPKDTSSKDSIVRFLLKHNANVNAKDSFGSTPLHYAAMRGNVSAVKQLLTRKEINIEAKDGALMTAMHIASSHGSLDVCKVLLHAGCDYSSGHSKMSALHFAATEGHLEIAKLLITNAEDSDKVADIATVVHDQDVALHLAVENGHYDMVKFLIDQGANMNFVRGNFITLLHTASRYGKLDIVKLLVENGSDIDVKDGSLGTPLHTATLYNRLPVVQYLVEMGACIDCCDKDKETPLIVACRKGHKDIVSYLLGTNADISITDIRDRTCLYVASEGNFSGVCQILLDWYPRHGMIEEVDRSGNTPLHVASMKGHADVVQLLLDSDASVQTKNDANMTPLHLAAQNGKSKIIETLLQKNKRIVNDEDESSNTALHVASLEGHVNVVKILLKNGAAVDVRNATFWTPLDCAASQGWTKCAECLLNAHALIEPIDKQKVTPLHIASKSGHVSLIKLLISRKADVTRTDHLGANCLDWAIDNKQKDAAIAILQSDRWEEVLRSCTIEGTEILTPMRKMITKLPEVAEIVFDKCIESNGLPKEHTSYEITCNYEFLDDTFTEWGPLKQEIMDVSAQDEKIDVAKAAEVPQQKQKQYPFGKFPSFSLQKLIKRKDEVRIQHPLQYMVQKGETKLLSHRLVTCLLRYKWQTFGRYVYYTHLAWYLFYLILVTGFAMTIVGDDYYNHCYNTTKGDNSTYLVCECERNTTSNYYHPPSKTTRLVFDTSGRLLIIIISVLMFSVEILKLLTDVKKNANFPCFLKIISYVSSVTYVLCSYDFEEGSQMEFLENWRCSYPHKSLGAIALWLSWINLVVFIQVFPKLGIYVVMFTEISRTCFQCFPIVVLFIIAFGLGFHILLYRQTDAAISYETPLRSMLKTLIGMLCEFEYDAFFNGPIAPVETAWVMYFLYIFCNCIIVMNMLVGLAVDDIKGVQEQAALKRLGMQVDHTIDVEKILPHTYQKKYAKLEECVVVNKKNRFTLWSFWHKRSSRESNMSAQMTDMETLMKVQDEMTEYVRSLNSTICELTASNGRKEAMIESLLGKYMKHSK